MLTVAATAFLVREASAEIQLVALAASVSFTWRWPPDRSTLGAPRSRRKLMIPPRLRSLFAFSHDVLAAGIAWCAAYWLRFNLDLPHNYAQMMFERLPYVFAVHAAVFWMLGLYRGLWRYASLPDLQRIVLAAGIAALTVPALLALLRIDEPVPRTVYLIAPLLLVAAMSADRLLYRAWKERGLPALFAHPNATPVLLLAAGDAGALLLKDPAGTPAWRLLGLLDDDARKLRRHDRA